MAGFKNLQSLIDAEEMGKSSYTVFRKRTSAVTVSGGWIDLMLSTGVPAPFYYASTPLVAATMSQSTGGIRHAGTVTPDCQFVRKLSIITGITTGYNGRNTIKLLDYLLYYPFVDESTTDVQEMDNTVTLSRYTTGKGVMIMPVVVAPHATGGVEFVVTYTNQDGVAGRTTAPCTLSTIQTVTSTIAGSANATLNSTAPFLTLQSGDSGVRSIQSLQFTTGTDVGLLTLVLVKPLANIWFTGGVSGTLINTTLASGISEYDLLTMQGMLMPEILPDACLNFVMHVANFTTSTETFHGELHTTWG